MDDERVMQVLRATSGSDWFSGGARGAFLAAHPTAVHDSWEIVPGATIGPLDLRARRGLAGVLLCDIGERSPVRVERSGEIRIGIDDGGCRAEGGSPASEPGSLGRLFG